jgi:hypothetical protein
MAGPRVAWRVGLTIVVTVACASPTPTFTPSAAPSQPSPSPSASPSASPSPTATAQPTVAFTHYGGEGFSFDYPSDWRVITDAQFTGAQYVLVVVGTGEWQSGCVTSGNATTCGPNHLIADPGEVVAEFSLRGMGPAVPIYELPPVGSTILESGLAASVDDGPSLTRAAIFVSGADKLAVDVRYGGPPTDNERASVHRMIESLAPPGGVSAPTIDHWASTAIEPASCARKVVRGRLGRGDVGGINVTSADYTEFNFLVWPQGWTARVGADRRTELHDDTGAFVAREWDEVEIGGRGDPNEFRVCPDAVSVLRAFPSSGD